MTYTILIPKWKKRKLRSILKKIDAPKHTGGFLIDLSYDVITRNMCFLYDFLDKIHKRRDIFMPLRYGEKYLMEISDPHTGTMELIFTETPSSGELSKSYPHSYPHIEGAGTITETLERSTTEDLTSTIRHLRRALIRIDALCERQVGNFRQTLDKIRLTVTEALNDKKEES